MQYHTPARLFWTIIKYCWRVKIFPQVIRGLYEYTRYTRGIRGCTSFLYELYEVYTRFYTRFIRGLYEVAPRFGAIKRSVLLSNSKHNWTKKKVNLVATKNYTAIKIILFNANRSSVYRFDLASVTYAPSNLLQEFTTPSDLTETEMNDIIFL